MLTLINTNVSTLFGHHYICC